MSSASCRPASAHMRRRRRLRTAKAGDLTRSAGLAIIPRREADTQTGRLVRRHPGEIVFEVAALTVGRHRFFFDFTYAGRTRTASFTQEVTS